MVNYGVKKTSKGVKQRTDEDKTGKQTRDRRRSDGEKNMDDIHRPYLIQRVLAAPLFKIQRSHFGCSPPLYTLHSTPYALRQILPYLLIQSVQDFLLYLFAAFEAGDAAFAFGCYLN